VKEKQEAEKNKLTLTYYDSLNEDPEEDTTPIWQRVYNGILDKFNLRKQESEAEEESDSYETSPAKFVNKRNQKALRKK
jgi:hypothetical protein